MAVARIYVDGEICPDSWAWYCDDYTSLAGVRKQIDEAGDVDEYEIYIFSPGGYCSEGWAIHDFLLTTGKKITTVAYGQCASIATVIYMAGETRKITEGTDFMIHLPWGWIEGNENQVYSFWKELVVEGDRIANRYAARTSMDKEAIKVSMNEDNHMTAAQAVELGYATEILGATSAKALQNRADGKHIKVRKPVAYLREPNKNSIRWKEKEKPEEPVKPVAVVKQKVAMKKTTYSPLQLFARGSKNAIKGLPFFALEVNVDGGKTLVIDVQSTDGNAAVGDPCTIDGTTAPAGEYTAASDKTVYTVGDDGKLTAIAEAAAPENTDTATSEQVAQLTVQLATANKNLATVTAERDQLKKDVTARDTALASANKMLTDAQSKQIELQAKAGEEDDEEKEKTGDGGEAKAKAKAKGADYDDAVGRRKARAAAKEAKKK